MRARPHPHTGHNHVFPRPLCAAAATGVWHCLPTPNELERSWHPRSQRGCSFAFHHRCRGEAPMAGTADLTPRSPTTTIPQVWRIFRVVHAMGPPSHPPDRALMLHAMHRAARDEAARAASAAARGDRVLSSSIESISARCSLCRSGGPILRSWSHATCLGSLESLNDTVSRLLGRFCSCGTLKKAFTPPTARALSRTNGPRNGSGSRLLAFPYARLVLPS